MKYIDLHVHSSHSDGTDSPSEVIRRAAARGLAAIALTDHDTVSGISEALEAARQETLAGRPIRLIPGIEISAGYKDRDIHILGLFLQWQDSALNKALEIAVASREQRNETMAKRLRDAGISITVEALRKGEPDTVITRAHFAKFLTENGYVRTKSEAFEKYLDVSTPYYVPREYIAPSEAVRLIKNAGGIAVLAHPLLYESTLEGTQELIAHAVQSGIEGIEAIYSSNTNSDEQLARSYAANYQLLITGGSDYHGSNKPMIHLGTGKGNLKIPYYLLERLETYLQSRPNI